MHQFGLFEHLTYKANLKHTRYGWLRLTPAYSVHLVEDLLTASSAAEMVVLDPFCGTGTTALVCSERGISSYTTDINPFLLWLTKIKTQVYSHTDTDNFIRVATDIERAIMDGFSGEDWVPSIHQIEKWWNQDTLDVLSGILQYIHHSELTYSSAVIDLLKVAFCRIMIKHSNASFNHQSMSFNKQQNVSIFSHPGQDILLSWQAAVKDISNSVRTEILTPPTIVEGDARHIANLLPHNYYTCIITSPPYPNRMSYIRELRPYMYWLKFLNDGKQAGELDWKAIGGTWGIATSNVGKWTPLESRSIPYDGMTLILESIGKHSDTLARYVHKYFYDMIDHVNNIFMVTKKGGCIHYIVGNSKFYDVLLPVEEIFASLFRNVGFCEVTIKPIRKRTSKKELYEYIVSAVKP